MKRILPAGRPLEAAQRASELPDFRIEKKQALAACCDCSDSVEEADFLLSYIVNHTGNADAKKALRRVLIWVPPMSNGQTGSRIDRVNKLIHLLLE